MRRLGAGRAARSTSRAWPSSSRAGLRARPARVHAPTRGGARATPTSLWVAFDTPVDERDEADSASCARAARGGGACAARGRPRARLVAGAGRLHARRSRATGPGAGCASPALPENLRLGPGARELPPAGARGGRARRRGATAPAWRALLAPFAAAIEWMSRGVGGDDEARAERLPRHLGRRSSTRWRGCARRWAPTRKEVERGLKSEARDRRRGPTSRPAPPSPAARWPATCASSAGFGERHGVPTPLSTACSRATRLHAGLAAREGRAAARGAPSARWPPCWASRTSRARARCGARASVELCRVAARRRASRCGPTTRPCARCRRAARPGCRLLRDRPRRRWRAPTWPSWRRRGPSTAALGADDFVARMRRPCVDRPDWFLAATLGRRPARRLRGDRAAAAGRGHDERSAGRGRHRHRRQPGLGRAIAARFVAGGRERAADRARRGAALQRPRASCAARGAPGQRAHGLPGDVSDPRTARPPSRAPRAARPASPCSSTTPASTARSGRIEDVRLGRVGGGASAINLFGTVAHVPRGHPAHARAAATARSSTSRAAAPRRRCRASAPTRRPRRRWCASPRRSPRSCGRARRRQRDRARRAEHAAARRGAGGRARRSVGARVLRAVAEAAGRGRRAAREGRGARRLPRLRGERRHQRPAAERGVGRLGRPARRGATTLADERRLHAAPHRARGPRGMALGEARGAIVGCGLVGRQARARASGREPAGRGGRHRPERARGAGRRTSPAARSSADWRARVSRAPTWTLVIVATTNDALAPVTLRRRRAGKHVLVEKPAARRAGGAGARASTPRASAGVVGQGRLQPPLPPGAPAGARALRRAARSARCCTSAARYGHGGRLGYEREWRADPAVAGGGELLDQGVHLIDLARWFAGRLRGGRAGTLATFFWDMPVEDNGFLLLQTAAGPGGLAARELHRVEEPVLVRDLRPRRQAAGRRARRQLRRSSG